MSTVHPRFTDRRTHQLARTKGLIDQGRPHPIPRRPSIPSRLPHLLPRRRARLCPFLHRRRVNITQSRTRYRSLRSSISARLPYIIPRRGARFSSLLCWGRVSVTQGRARQRYCCSSGRHRLSQSFPRFRTRLCPIRARCSGRCTSSSTRRTVVEACFGVGERSLKSGR